jgi:hypothetical protein
MCLVVLRNTVLVGAACLLTAWFPRQQQHSRQETGKQAVMLLLGPNWLRQQHQHLWGTYASKHGKLPLIQPADAPALIEKTNKQAQECSPDQGPVHESENTQPAYAAAPALVEKQWKAHAAVLYPTRLCTSISNGWKEMQTRMRHAALNRLMQQHQHWLRSSEKHMQLS